MFDGMQNIVITKNECNETRQHRTRTGSDANMLSQSNDFELLLKNKTKLNNYQPVRDIMIVTIKENSQVTTKDMPLAIKNHNLLLIKVLLRSGGTRLITRWYEGYSWNIVDRSRKNKIINNYQSNCLVLGGGVEIAICCKISPSDSHDHIITQSLIRQIKAYCHKHKEWLMKVPINLKKKRACDKFKRKACNNQSQWRCPHGLNTFEGFHCEVSICNYCMKKISDDDDPIPVGTPANVEHAQEAGISAFDELHESFSEDDEDHNVPSISIIDDIFDDADRGNESDDDDENIAVIDSGTMMSDIDILDDDGQQACTNHEQSCYDPKLRTPSHIIFNNYLKTLKRNVSRNQSSKTSFLLNQIVRSTGSPSVSLMCPESMLHPSIFYSSENNSVIRSIPNYACGDAKTLSGRNIASLHDHIFVRARDGSLATSHSVTLNHWNFDWQLNERLNHNSSELVFKRGFEHLTEKGVTGQEITESNIDYDQNDASRKVKELAAFMKWKPWDIFYTFTSNDKLSPGLRKLHAAFKHACQEWITINNIHDPKTYENMHPWYEDFEYDHAQYQRLYEQNLLLITRVWERTFNYFVRFLEESPVKVMGKVDGQFARKEFQPDEKSPGNKSHGHGGVSIDGMSKEEIANLICLDPTFFFSEKYGTSYEQLLEDGLVDDEKDFDALVIFVNIVIRHICSKGNGRCMKPRGLNNELMCRIPKHPESSINYFKEKINIYEEDVYKILEELGLAHLVDLTRKEELFDYDIGRGVKQKWETHEAFKAGSWHYINYSNEVDSKFTPVIPIVVCMLRCSCNAQIVNLKFMMSYLVKYVTEKESRPYVNFNAGNKKNEVSVDKTNKDHVNEKISGVRIKNKENNKHDLTNNNNVMEVCLTEVCHNVLKMVLEKLK